MLSVIVVVVLSRCLTFQSSLDYPKVLSRHLEIQPGLVRSSELGIVFQRLINGLIFWKTMPITRSHYVEVTAQETRPWVI